VSGIAWPFHIRPRTISCHKRVCDRSGRREDGVVSDNANLQPDAKAENRVFVLILQHPQERREPLATAAIAVAALRRAKLAVGLSWPNLGRVLGRQADPRRWGALYLGSAHPAAAGAEQELAVVGGRGEP